MLTPPTSIPDLETLNFSVLTEIQQMAAGMAKEEILDTYSIKWDSLDKSEQIYFDEFYNYGRGMAIKVVVGNLIDATKGKSGVPASMAFLRRFAKEFEGEVEGDSSGTFSFQFGKAD